MTSTQQKNKIRINSITLSSRKKLFRQLCQSSQAEQLQHVAFASTIFPVLLQTCWEGGQALVNENVLLLHAIYQSLRAPQLGMPQDSWTLFRAQLGKPTVILAVIAYDKNQ